ncbi:winged-helix domain-containing protein [Chloroflexota bacterium]
MPINTESVEVLPLPKVKIIAEESKEICEFQEKLRRDGFTCFLSQPVNSVLEDTRERLSDLVLLEVNGRIGEKELAAEIRQRRHLPVIALVHQESLRSMNGNLNHFDDFIVYPCDAGELRLRLAKTLHKSSSGINEIIRYGNLVIDQARCEVTVAGSVVMLAFREYELLRFLASNRGRTFSRDALLDKVWGYDYFGGDRTVDVHIRRLRSKIEDTDQSYIETVRNIGYRFRKHP